MNTRNKSQLIPVSLSLLMSLLLPSIGWTTDSLVPANVFDVREFGAKGNGKTLDTMAIQKALDECGNAGGGIVRFPVGTYLSKPIFLHSQMTLRLDAGAILQATSSAGPLVSAMNAPTL